MATIAGTLDVLSTTFSVTLSSAPVTITGWILSGRPKFVATDSHGDYTFVLRQGHYVVRIPHTPAFNILVPGGTGTYDLSDIYNDAGAEMIQPDQIFNTLSEMMADTGSAQIVWVNALGSGGDQGEGMFRRGGSGTHDGVNVIVRTDNVVYTRIQTT